MKESEPERTSYLFGSDRGVMRYSSNGNATVIVHKTITDVAVQTNENDPLFSRIFRIYRKPNESCVVS